MYRFKGLSLAVILSVNFIVNTIVRWSAWFDQIILKVAVSLHQVGFKLFRSQGLCVSNFVQ